MPLATGSYFTRPPNHPITGKRQPLSMDPKDAKHRAEWMKSYKVADEADKKGFTACNVGVQLTVFPATTSTRCDAVRYPGAVAAS